MAEEQDVVVHYLDSVEIFDKDLQLTLSDIRGHFGVSGGSLKVGGKVKVVKPDIIVPPGVYVLDIPQRGTQGTSSHSLPTTPSAPVTSSLAPPTSTVPSPTAKPNPTEHKTLSITPATDDTILPIKEPKERTTLTRSYESAGSSKFESPAKIKRELESKEDLEVKKPKIHDPKHNSLPPSVSQPTIPTKLFEDLETKPLIKPALDPSLLLPTLQKDTSKSQSKLDDKQNDKENYANYDWKTKINISTTNLGSNRTSSVIASITSTSKPTTPERKRQKNEIITRILAREADRKTLRETFMNVEQMKEEMTEEMKASMSSSEVLHRCEVSWFNKFRDNN